MDEDHQAGVPQTRWRLTNDGKAAVDLDYYWQDMEKCPTNTKVQLLTRGGIAIYGSWDGKDSFYTHWAPCPKLKKTLAPEKLHEYLEMKEGSDAGETGVQETSTESAGA